jgi:phosphotransferase system enzyme I (PtsI)
VIKNILGLPQRSLADVPQDSIIVARDLTPSDTAQLNPGRIKGFCTETGGATSHSAIIARMHGIPAVVGVAGLLSSVSGASPGCLIAVDGDKGEIYIEPDSAALAELEHAEDLYRAHKERLKALKTLPAESLDGHRVELAANITSASDCKSALEHGAEAIGLFRTEFLFLNRPTPPGEDEQFAAYKATAERMAPRPVIIRTLDIGGDKKTDCIDIPDEANPFLGWRAIRICLDTPELFKTQLRALLRAGAHGKIRIMYPMISRVEELRAANAILEECKNELEAEGQAYDKNIETGIMIEVPSAAVIADILIEETDFFSIGTNDLIQYAAAVDRMNERIAELYEPLNPGILRLIKMVIDASHRVGKWTGMCGEMAGDPAYAALLLGLGLDEFSVNAAAIPEVKNAIRSVSLESAKKLAECALSLATAGEIVGVLEGK